MNGLQFAERYQCLPIRCSGRVISLQNEYALYYWISGLRSVGVTFPPHDSSDAGSNPAEGVVFLRAEKFREQVLREGTLSCLTRVVDLLHVKEPQAPRGPLSKIIGHFPSKI
jgi:hypothetical protein